MKQSTKILAGTILFVMLVIISHYVALFAMKRAGAYTEIYREEESKPLIGYPENIRVFKVKGFTNVILEMADTFHYECQYYDETDHVRWKAIGDSLIMEGDTTRYDTLRNGRVDTVYEQAQNTLTIYTTGKEKLVLELCSSSIKPGEGDRALELDLELITSVLNTDTYRDTMKWYNYELKMLKASCTDAAISLYYDWQVTDMHVILRNSSSFSDGAATMKKGTVSYDLTSRINLTGYNIGKLRLNRAVP